MATSIFFNHNLREENPMISKSLIFHAQILSVPISNQLCDFADIVNAGADSGGAVGVLVAVELDVANETSACAWAAEGLGLNGVIVSSAPWSSGSITSKNFGGISFNCGVGGGGRVLGGNGREEAGSEGKGDELVYLIYLYLNKSLFDNSQNIKRRKTTPLRCYFQIYRD